MSLRDKKAAQKHSNHASPEPDDINHAKQDDKRKENNDEVNKDHDEQELHEGQDKKDLHLSKKELLEKLEKAEKETQALSDRLLRTLAEFDNYKKRIVREKDDLIKYGNERLALELLPIVDNFERALEQAKNALEIEQVIAGIDLILKQFLSVLERFQVKAFSSVGELFDPQKHEAMVHQEHKEYAENTVMEEFQKGYYLRDKLLRPAQVIVSKRPEEENEEAEQVPEE